jgi:hypothetical protein
MIDTLVARLEAQGIRLRKQRLGENRAACPRCDKNPKDDALAVRIEHDSATWVCHRCGWSGAAFDDRNHTTREARPYKPAPPSHKPNVAGYESARRIWLECVPLDGTPGAEYLQRRGCRLPPDAGDVRFHPRLYCSKVGGELPALVCRVSTVFGNRGAGIHRIFLDRSGGTKAVAKMRLGGGADEPVCIRLWPDEDVTLGLALAEGIESALAAAHVFTPIWSTIDAGNLVKFPVLLGIESLTVFMDNDEAGRRAGEQCVERWSRANCEANIIMHPRSGADANDFDYSGDR